MVSCSQAEINLYNALKQLSVAFAPLPVFIRGGREYKRIEPDFIIVRNGVMLHVEVDGDTVHKETPADAHERASLLTSEGVIIERVRASECATTNDAAKCARRLLGLIDKHKSNM